MMEKHEKDKDVDLPLEDAEVHASPEYDDDDDMSPDSASPDFLATPKKGKGVRRLNGRPLIVVGVLLFLAVSAIIYTYFQRLEQNRVAASKPKQTHVSGPVATPPVKPTGEYIPPTQPAQAEIPAAAPPQNAPQQQPMQQMQPMAAEPSEAMQHRLRQIQQIEDKRLQDWDQALRSDAGVQGFGETGKGQNQNRQQQNNGAGQPDIQSTLNQYLAAAGGQSQQQQGGGMGGMGGMGADDGGMAGENRQAQKRAFLAGTAEANTYLAHERTNAIAPSLELKAGHIIPGVLISGINSDLPGQILAQVSQPVFDTVTGQNMLVPAGAKLIGTYDSAITLGQQRALVAWTRIIFPDGSSISLDNMPGADQEGYGGFSDQVNNHLGRIFGYGLLLSTFSAGVQLSQPQATNGENLSSSQIIAGSLGQQMGQLGMQMAQRNMNIQPTLEIRPGYQFNIMVTKDIILPPWQGHPMAMQRAAAGN